MSTWLIALIVPVVVIGLVMLAVVSRARKRREASSGIGLSPIGALSVDEPPAAQAESDPHLEEHPGRETAGQPGPRSR